MAKPFSAKHATTILEKYRKRAPKEHWEKREIIDVLSRLPTDIDDDVVVPALIHEIRDSKVDGSRVSCLLTATPSGGVPPNPARWASVVVRALEKFPRDPHAAFYLAALPKDRAKWAEHLVKIDGAIILGLWNAKRFSPEQRERVLRPLASDPAIVAGARAAAARTKPSQYECWWWILAAEGSRKSLPLIESFVKATSKNKDNADWLASAFAPLMTSKDTAPVRARLTEAVVSRAAPGLDAARAMGIVTKALRFKVGMYAAGGMPRIRLWVDSSKDPWFDARWNWDELVTGAKKKKGTPAIDDLRAFLRACVEDGKGRFTTWELQTAHRGEDKDKLVAFLSEELKGLRGPNAPSAPLKSFRG